MPACRMPQVLYYCALLLLALLAARPNEAERPDRSTIPPNWMDLLQQQLSVPPGAWGGGVLRWRAA